MNQRFEPCIAPPLPRFTPKQGQYLAFIHAYTLVLGRPPAHADLLRHFRVTPPSVNQILITLERQSLIRRQRGVARSIELLIDPSTLPQLRPSPGQPVKTAAEALAEKSGRDCSGLSTSSNARKGVRPAPKG
jgi:hypothetical protein